jgi:hypothetical protein
VQPGYVVYPTETTTYYFEAEDADGNQQSSSRPVTVDPSIVNGKKDVPYTGTTGTPGWPGMSGAPGRPGSNGGPGGPGGNGPDLTVNIGQYDGWLLQVVVTPSGGNPTTFYVVPSKSPSLVVSSVGGTGGTGGVGGPAGVMVHHGKLDLVSSGSGGPGGTGGPGGNVTVNCPSALQAQAEASLAYQSGGGAGGPGGAPGPTPIPGGPTGLKGQPGGPGRPGHVTWHVTG